MTETHGALSSLRAHKGVNALATPHHYRAANDDPQMLWSPEGDLKTLLNGRGAVRVTVRMRALDGRLTSPNVYFDWGDGFSEESRADLMLVEDGVYTTVGNSNAGALRRLRFDPSSSLCDFAIDDFRVEPATEAQQHVRQLSLARRLLRRGVRRLPVGAQNMMRGAWRGLVKPRGGNPLAHLLGGRNPWRAAYAQAFDVTRNLRSPQFAAPPLAPPRRRPDEAKVVAFYLPQFHPIAQNDAWWGKGFTEWANVAKALPQFTGHQQPRLPSDLGYYDLRVPEVRRAQADLAKQFGVDAFCFHYYWFGGERLLERPLDDFANDPEIDLPFALSWANENWTRRWDGQESDILMGQRHSPGDDVAVFDDIARYMRSPRYLRVGGKLMLSVYRPDIMPDPAGTVARWRARAREIGLGEIFLLCTNAFGFYDYGRFGFDGVLEFPPHALALGEITDEVERLNPDFSGRVYDYAAVASRKTEELIQRRDPRCYPGVMPAWDNEARKPGAGHVFHGATPELFHNWIKAALDCTYRLAQPDERLVFVNAWNEWAEGAYLEPDRWFGHGFGHGVRSAIETRAPRIPDDHPLVVDPARSAKRHDTVVLLHLYYPELIDDFAARLAPLADLADVHVTFPDTWPEAELARLAARFPNARLNPEPNLGRDVAPFIAALRRAREAGYDTFCKLHSKRSPHMNGGDAWRDRLVAPLTSPEAARTFTASFRNDPRLGLAAAARSRLDFSDPNVLFNNRAALDVIARRLNFKYDDKTAFVGGTMFWGRVKAFDALVEARDDLSFEPELGRIDGTLAHALERAMVAIVTASGHGVKWSSEDGSEA